MDFSDISRHLAAVLDGITDFSYGLVRSWFLVLFHRTRGALRIYVAGVPSSRLSLFVAALLFVVINPLVGIFNEPGVTQLRTALDDHKSGAFVSYLLQTSLLFLLCDLVAMAFASGSKPARRRRRARELLRYGFAGWIAGWSIIDGIFFGFLFAVGRYHFLQGRFTGYLFYLSIYSAAIVATLAPVSIVYRLQSGMRFRHRWLKAIIAVCTVVLGLSGLWSVGELFRFEKSIEPAIGLADEAPYILRSSCNLIGKTMVVDAVVVNPTRERVVADNEQPVQVGIAHSTPEPPKKYFDLQLQGASLVVIEPGQAAVTHWSTAISDDVLEANSEWSALCNVRMFQSDQESTSTIFVPSQKGHG